MSTAIYSTRSEIIGKLSVTQGGQIEQGSCDEDFKGTQIHLGNNMILVASEDL